MELAPLPDTKAALMLSLCALSHAGLPTLILLRSLPRTGTFILLDFSSALSQTLFFYFESCNCPACRQFHEALKLQLKKTKQEQQGDLCINQVGVAGSIYDDVPYAQQFAAAIRSRAKVNMNDLEGVLCEHIIHDWRSLDSLTPQEAHAS
eukprot:966526-Pelagomonas_calceolata.AAC.2